MNINELVKAGKPLTLTEQLHISASNSKTGYPSFNTLAGDIKENYKGYCPQSLKNIAAEISGTCSQTCTDCNGRPACYAFKMTRYIAVFWNYAENTTLVKNNLKSFKNQINEYLSSKKPPVFRVHDSGDFFSYEYFRTWCEIAAENPQTTFYTYTKEFELIRHYLFTDKKEMPKNLIINLSVWSGIADFPHDLINTKIFGVFEYDDNGSSTAPHCPAVNASGKRTGVTCKQCGRCTRRLYTAVYPH